MTNQEKLYEAARNKLHVYVAQNELRYSPTRLIVLETVCNLNQPFTADELQTACGTQVSAGTVYNALKLFLKAGILHAMERQRGKAATQYEIVLGSKVRMQLVCEVCGRVHDFHDRAIERIVKTKKLPNFNYKQFTLFVYGQCKKCKTKNA